jgi:hypothetical protein
MFDAHVLESIRPKGMEMKVTETPQEEGQESDRRFYKTRISGKILDGTIKETEVTFSLPVPRNGIFQVNDLQRFVIPQAMVDLGALDFSKRVDYFVKPRSQVVYDAMVEVFDAAFTDFYMTGQPMVSLTLQNEIDGWFKTSPMTQDVPRNKVGQRSLWELVHLRIPDGGLDLTEREFNPDWLNRLDPASTPSGDKVNRTYRLVKGAKIEDGKIVPGDGLFCSTIEDHHMPVALCPRRTHISRSAYESHITLESYEDPLVGKPGLFGRHLLTAIMRYGTLNGEDAIVISESAAEKLRSAQMVNESFYAMGAFKLLVKEGEMIGPDRDIAEVTDPITQKTTIVRPKKLANQATVKHIRHFKSSYFGVPATRVRITAVSSAHASSGDKVFARGAVKGVLRVLPDTMMPINKDGQTIEAIISPESVVGRRAMSVYWEGMANRYVQGGGKVTVDHFDPRPTFEEFVKMGLGDPEVMFLNGERLPEPVWSAPIYFIRLDKIAGEIVSIHSGSQALNAMGLPVDSARAGGQRRDFAKGASMVARGMGSILGTLLEKNMKAPHALKELRKVLMVKKPEETQVLTTEGVTEASVAL